MTKAILVSSLKGGCGKTSVAVNMARQLEDVTVVDGDVTSSNFASVMNVGGKSEITENHRIKPVSKDGVDIFSVETYFEDTTVSLRKGAEMGIIESLVGQGVENSDEYMIIDCPPGASSGFRGIVDALSKRDVERTAVGVFEPNTHSDMKRFVNICNHIMLPIAGFIENKRGIENTSIYPLGKEGVETYCEELDGNFLGWIPYAEKPERRDEVVEPVAKRTVDYIVENGPFLDKKTYADPSIWDKIKSGLNMGINMMSKDLPVGELGKRYGFKENHLTLELHITDIGYRARLGVRGNKITPIGGKPESLVGGVKIPLKELRDALSFERDVLYSPTGEEMTMNYSLTKAVKLGFAQVWENREKLDEMGINWGAWDFITMLDYLLREEIGKEKIEGLAKEAEVGEI